MDREFRADLHVHSRCSDGVDAPCDLLDLAKAAHLSGLSITDHDTIQAYTDDFFEKAKVLKIHILLGAELSSEWEGKTVHVLGYHMNHSIQAFLNEVVKKRESRNERILKALALQGIHIGMEELKGLQPSSVIGRPHIAALLVKKGAAASLQEAFDRYLQDSASSYARGGKYTPLEVIDAIHSAQGKAILAHPHFIKSRSFLRALLALPFDGIECYYASLPRDQEKRWMTLAKEKKWIATGGSDYHGPARPYNPLGSSWVDEETFLKLSS